LGVSNIDNLRHFAQPRSLFGYSISQFFGSSAQNIMTGGFQLSTSLWLLANSGHVGSNPISQFCWHGGASENSG
jgi:hypothetical protein